MSFLSELAQNPFYEFAAILMLGALLGAVGQLLKQPLIVMFIALGIIAGPSVLDIVHSKENIHLLAEIGIALLLFIVGLKLDLRIIKSVGKIAFLTGMGQVIFTSIIGFGIGILLGLSPLHSFYVAVALTFSSTIIIVKLLSDKKEIDSLHGQIAIGFLIVQDIVVILVMVVLSALRQQQDFSLGMSLLKTAGSGAVMLAATLVLMRWIIPVTSLFLARSQELLTLFAIAWAVTLATIGQLMGFSGEVGAFLAGVSLASSPFKDVISSRLVSLRDFLLLFFFVNLGASLDLSLIGNQVGPALVLSAFVLIGNPIIVLVIMGAMGYRKRTGFLAGLTVAQISEFSLIFAGLGLAVGHITEEILGLITLVGLITIGLSTYMILYSYKIYDVIAPILSVFERKHPYREGEFEEVSNKNYDVIIFGLGRFGKQLADLLDEQQKLSYLAVDFDPQMVKHWKEKGRNIVYGDLEDPEIMEHLNFQGVKYIINTIPNIDAAIHLTKTLKRAKFGGKVFLTAAQDKDFGELSKCNVEEILVPHKLAATNFFNAHLVSLRR
jgi:Kef-type K+ transport system membrane component KefB